MAELMYVEVLLVVNIERIKQLVIYRTDGEFTHAHIDMLDGKTYMSVDKWRVFELSRKAESMGMVTDLETLAVKYIYTNFVIGEEEE